MNKGKLYQNIFDPEIVHSDLVKHMQGKMGQEMLDPTNTFALMLESIGESASEAVQASVAITRKVYPSLCNTSEEILRHATSDELIGLYASPSSTILSVYMNAIDVLNVGQASDISLDTRFVQMSKRTRFTVGGITFCSVNDVRIHYDGLSSLVEQVTSYDYGFNRYGSLNSYLIDDVDGGKWIKFDIPVRQFDYQIFESDVVGSYDARFPVIGQLWYTRAVGLFPDGERELAITHSDIVYDVAIPTLKITPLEGELKAHLPNIYLVNGTAPTKITLTIYGTHGAFNMNLRE
ncbi:MAG: hypothetical protein KAG66_22420, partial [Methylococcales bacterium]|nr:hypothetical protein [Methylococcales bacterium]